jgi:tRNA(fMet)-specific endonuclease VapC
MSGSEVALDTNQAIALLNGTGDIAAWLQGLAAVSLPVPVIGDLRFGALNSRRPVENLQRIEQLVARCRVLNATVTTADVYARLRSGLKKKGKPIRENDVWIAALCIEHGLPLATADEHFGLVDGLTVIRR